MTKSTSTCGEQQIPRLNAREAAETTLDALTSVEQVHLHLINGRNALKCVSDQLAALCTAISELLAQNQGSGEPDTIKLAAARTLLEHTVVFQVDQLSNWVGTELEDAIDLLASRKTYN